MTVSRAHHNRVTHVRRALRSPMGAIDLASIMVGVLVIGILGAIIAATVFAVIPWSQDRAAAQSLDAVNTAESASRGLQIGYVEYDSHPNSAHHRLEAATGSDKVGIERPKERLIVDAEPESWVAVIGAATGKVFIRASDSPEVYEAEDGGYLLAAGSGSPSVGKRIMSLPTELVHGLPEGFDTARVQRMVDAVVGRSDAAKAPYKFSYVAPEVPVTPPAPAPAPIPEVPLTLTYGAETIGFGSTVSVTPTVDNAKAPVTYSLTGTLPTGLSFDPATGTIARTAAWSPTVRTVEAGATHSCALTSDGAALCWGSNGNGQLADGTLVVRPTPVAAAASLGKLKDVRAGVDNTCFITTADDLYCLGSNSFGKLGTTSTQGKPALVAGMDEVRSVALGIYHTCAVEFDGSVWCWGYNSKGQLGDGTTKTAAAPVKVAGISTATAVAVGADHSCAALADGTVACWGGNTGGKIGDGTSVDRLKPTAVVGLSNVNALDSNNVHTCASTTAGKLYCWGQNGNAQIGSGITGHQLRPIAVNVNGTVASFSTGLTNTCASTTDGAVHCWGADGLNRNFGVGSPNVPTTSKDIAGVVAVSLGDNHSCAVTGDGQTLCVGSRAAGQTGTGTVSNTGAQNKPAPIANIGNLGFPAELSITATAGTKTATTSLTVTLR